MDIIDTALDAVEGVAEQATGRDLDKVRALAEEIVRRVDAAPESHVHDPSLGGTDKVRAIAYGVADVVLEMLEEKANEVAPAKPKGK